MQRDHINTVTTIPVLISCSRDEQQGEATFEAHGGPVREVTAKDFDKKTGKHRKFLDAMQDHERQHFAGVVGLLRAIEERDSVAVAKARQQLLEAQAKEAQRGEALGWKDNERLGQLLASGFGLKADQGKEALEILGGYRWPSGTAKDAAKILSLEISRTLALWVELVFWWTGERFTPALYCIDPKVAPYVYILTHKGWGVCPHCGEWFQKDRSDQNYCRIAHREAHRVARWRAKVAKSKKKGDKRVTGKAR
jgi:hypothetical protein